MLKKTFFAGAAGLFMLTFSSCGIFKKDCGCPHVSYKQPIAVPRHA